MNMLIYTISAACNYGMPALDGRRFWALPAATQAPARSTRRRRKGRTHGTVAQAKRMATKRRNRKAARARR